MNTILINNQYEIAQTSVKAKCACDSEGPLVKISLSLKDRIWSLVSAIFHLLKSLCNCTWDSAIREIFQQAYLGRSCYRLFPVSKLDTQHFQLSAFLSIPNDLKTARLFPFLTPAEQSYLRCSHRTMVNLKYQLTTIKLTPNLFKARGVYEKVNTIRINAGIRIRKGDWQALRSRFPNVQIILASAPKVLSFDDSITLGISVSIANSAQHFSQIHHLDIRGHCRLRPDNLMDIFQKTSQLTQLKLAEGAGLYDPGSMKVIAQNCPQLKHFTFTGDGAYLTDASMIAIAQHCPQLTHLNLGSSVGFTDEGIIAIARHCPQLTHLNIDYCANLTDASAIAIAQNCRQLTHFAAILCFQFTDEGIAAIVQNCPQLTHLAVTMVNLTDASMIAISQHCPQLTHLSIIHGNRLTDESMIAIAQHCPQLTHLSLKRITQLTDESMVAIAQHCSQLTYLSLTGGDQVTGASMRAIAQNCPHLLHFDLDGRNQLTDASGI